MALNTSGQRNFTSDNPNQLKFGLTNFGLINCDYFQRIPPDCRYTFAQQITDQNGNPITIPRTFRVINPVYNTYQEQNYHTRQTYDGMFESIFLVELDSKHLAIARNAKVPYTVISTMIVLDIEGKSAEEIAQLILENG